MAEVSAELNLKIAGLQQGLQQARGEMAAFNKYVATQGQGAGAGFAGGMKRGMGELVALAGVPIGIGAAVLGLKSMAEHFDQVGDTAAALNSSVEGVQRLQYMAAGTVTPFDQMANGLMRIKRALLEVDNDAKQSALESIGLNAKQFMGMDADKSFIQLARAYQTAQSTGKGFAEVMQLIKGASPDLFGAISTNTDVLLEMSQKSVVSAETMNTFVDSLGKLKMAGMESTNALVFAAGGLKDFGAAAAASLRSMVVGGDAIKAYIDSLQKSADAIDAEGAAAHSASQRRSRIAAAEIAQINELKAARAEEAAQRQAHAALKSAEGVTATEQSVSIAELRASGHGKQADKIERLQKGQQEFQRLRDAHPEKGEQWALDMAHRKDDAEHMKPGRIHGVAYKMPAPHAGLDWLYGHNTNKGGRPMSQEFKFPAMDRMHSTLERIERHLDPGS